MIGVRVASPTKSKQTILAVIYGFEGYTLDVKRRELRCGGKLRHVEPQVFDLLYFLIENRDRVVSRDEIFNAVWCGRIVSDTVLSTRINAARAALGDDGSQQRLIRTIHGRGFRFVGRVAAGSDEGAATHSGRPYRLALALDDAPMLAILPFASFGDDGQVRGLAQGLSEEVAASVHGIDWLLTVSGAPLHDGRGSVGIAPIRQQARYLVHGLVRRERDLIRAIIRLTEAASGIQLWAEVFHCPAAGSFELIATKTARAIGDHIFAAESMRSRQQRPEGIGAWHTIIRALNLINKRNIQQAGAAQVLLQKAITIDANSSTAFALLSFVATLGVHQGWHARHAAAPLAVRAAERAIALDDHDPWGLVAAGYAELFVANNAEHAIEILGGALLLNPGLAMAHYLIALASTYIDKPDEAFHHANLAERFAPCDLLSRGNPGVHDNVRATASFVAGRYSDGIAFARRAIAQSPHQTSAYRQLVISGAMAGELGEARKALQMVKRLAPEIGRFIRESEQLWRDKMVYRKYVEAFRLAGHE